MNSDFHGGLGNEVPWRVPNRTHHILTSEIPSESALCEAYVKKIEEAKEEAREEFKEEMVRRLRKAGSTFSFIANVLEMPFEEVEKRCVYLDCRTMVVQFYGESRSLTSAEEELITDLAEAYFKHKEEEKLEGKLEAIAAFLKAGIEPAFVANALKMPIEEVEKLCDRLQ